MRLLVTSTHTMVVGINKHRYKRIWESFSKLARMYAVIVKPSIITNREEALGWSTLLQNRFEGHSDFRLDLTLGTTVSLEQSALVSLIKQLCTSEKKC